MAVKAHRRASYLIIRHLHTWPFTLTYPNSSVFFLPIHVLHSCLRSSLTNCWGMWRKGKLTSNRSKFWDKLYITRSWLSTSLFEWGKVKIRKGWTPLSSLPISLSLWTKLTNLIPLDTNSIAEGHILEWWRVWQGQRQPLCRCYRGTPAASFLRHASSL